MREDEREPLLAQRAAASRSRGHVHADPETPLQPRRLSEARRKAATCRTVVIDVVYMVAFVSLNVVLNLFNKWTFTTIGLKVPLIATTIHEAVVFLVFGGIALCAHCCTAPRTSGRDNSESAAATDVQHAVACCHQWQFLPWNAFRGCSRTWIVVGLALVSALNYGFVAVSLMRLSHPDHQVLRALVPIFSALFFYAMERRQLSVVQFLSLVFTAVGAALAVSTHNSFWRVDLLGVLYCFVANIASAMQLSLIALVCVCVCVCVCVNACLRARVHGFRPGEPHSQLCNLADPPRIVTLKLDAFPSAGPQDVEPVRGTNYSVHVVAVRIVADTLHFPHERTSGPARVLGPASL